MIRLPNPPKEYDLTWANQYTRELETSIGNLESTVAQDNSDADAAAAAAAASAAEAAASAAEAAVSDTDAEASAAAAAASALAAAASATDAGTSATDAATSATDAASSATDAATSATAAGTSATAADTSATQAAGSATVAALSATQAASSATSAGTNAAAAQTSATQAAGSATAAGNSATAASTSAGEAVVSATNAAASAALASTSATSASTSAANAATSAGAAASSATSANTSAIAAATSATSASTSAGSAAGSATSAANSATSAANSATSAGNSASTATTQAAAAALSAANAAASETAAAGSATSASDSSIDAANSAAAAAASAAEVAEEIAGLPVNPEHYGAVGDGSTDCLAAFEAAIAVNGSIFVPNGTFRFSAEWSITGTQTSIVGEGRGITILKFDTGGIVVNVPSIDTDDIYAEVTVTDMTIMADSAGTSTGLAIVAAIPTSMEPTLNNLEFIGSDGIFGPSQTVTGTSHTSTTIDGIADTTGILVDSTVEGNGVAAGGYVTAVGASSVTIFPATTTSETTTFFFNAGPQKYWDVAIDLDGAWFPSISNIRISGGGAGRTTAGIYIHAGVDVAMFDYFLSHIEIAMCTTPILIDGQVEGLMLQQFDFYTSRDGIVATNSGALSVGTWQIEGGTIYCSRNPISIDHFSSIQISNMSPVRGVGEPKWCPPAAGVSYDSAIAGGFIYAGTNISITGDGDLVILSSIAIYNPSSLTTNAIYLEDIDDFLINGIVLLTGTFTNGLNFQGTTSKGTFDNIVSWGTITNPVVYGTTGYVRAGSFINGDNDAIQWSDARTAFSANDATPSVKPLYGKNYFYTANSGATTITQFDDAIPGQEFLVLINDSNTTLAHSANLILRNGINVSPANGDVYRFRQEGTSYAREVSRLTAALIGTTVTSTSGYMELSPSSSSATSLISIEGGSSSGFGALEIGGGSGAYIDLKTPMSDDNDMRILLVAGAASIATVSGTTLSLLAEGSSNEIALFTNGTKRLSILDGLVSSTVAIKTLSTTVASLPAAGTAGAGARAFVTDATATTFLSVVAGGGANAVPVVSNGTNWLIG